MQKIKSECIFIIMRGSRKFCQSGSNFDNIFSPVGREDPNKYHYKRAIIGPPVKRHLMAFRWRADDGPSLNAGLGFFRGSRSVLPENPIFL